MMMPLDLHKYITHVEQQKSFLLLSCTLLRFTPVGFGGNILASLFAALTIEKQNT